MLFRESPRPEILPGFKKVRFGAGKYAGFGGSIETGKSITAAAVREMEEETGDRRQSCGGESSARRAPNVPLSGKARLEPGCHVFVATIWEGYPSESEEMILRWFSLEQIPYEQMWGDAVYWLPRIVAGERIQARFIFLEDNEPVGELEFET